MNLRILEYLVTVAQERHFSRAAKKCYVSQPTLSTQLKKLEDTLGVVIFERDNKNVMLTRTGAKIVEQAKQVLLEAKELSMIAKNSVNPLSGKFKLGIIPTIGAYVIPSVLKKAKSYFPDMKLILVEDIYENLTKNLSSGELDAIVISGPVIEHKGISFKDVSSEELFVCINKDNKLASKKILTPRDLANETILTLDETHCLRKIILQLFSNDSLANDFKANSLITLIHLVAQNQGVTILPKMALIDCPENVVNIPLSSKYNKRDIIIGTRNLSSRVEAINGMINLLKDVCL